MTRASDTYRSRLFPRDKNLNHRAHRRAHRVRPISGAHVEVANYGKGYWPFGIADSFDNGNLDYDTDGYLRTYDARIPTTGYYRASMQVRVLWNAAPGPHSAKVHAGITVGTALGARNSNYDSVYEAKPEWTFYDNDDNGSNTWSRVFQVRMPPRLLYQDDGLYPFVNVYRDGGYPTIDTTVDLSFAFNLERVTEGMTVR